MADFNTNNSYDDLVTTIHSTEWSQLDLYSNCISPSEEDELISDFRESILEVRTLDDNEDDDNDENQLTDEEVDIWMQGMLPEETSVQNDNIMMDVQIQTPAPMMEASEELDFNPTPIGLQGYQLVHKVPLDNLLAMQESLKALLKPLQDELLEESSTTTTSVARCSKTSSPIPCVTSTSASPSSEYDSDDGSNHSDPSDAWNDRFQELMEYKAVHGHTNVPYHWPDNRPLSQWVKRQRHQYKLKQEGRHSNLSQEREERLNSIGFLWDSRAAHWDDRWEELRAYALKYGNVQVSKRTSKYRPLAVWLKRQRQYARLFLAGRSSMGMTSQRIEKLLELGVPLNLSQGKVSAATTAKRR